MSLYSMCSWAGWPGDEASNEPITVCAHGLGGLGTRLAMSLLQYVLLGWVSVILVAPRAHKNARGGGGRARACNRAKVIPGKILEFCYF